ncbi:8422_t:CDS:2, partial [Funneliformis geosporum]
MFLKSSSFSKTTLNQGEKSDVYSVGPLWEISDESGGWNNNRELHVNNFMNIHDRVLNMLQNDEISQGSAREDQEAHVFE